jgi:hypothetical protein
MCLTMKSFSLEFPSLGSPKSDNHDSKPTRIQNSNLQCSMISPYSKCLVHPKPCNHFTPLTLPLQYFGFRPWNPCEMTENELKAFCNLLSICLSNTVFIVSTYSIVTGSIPISSSAILTAFSSNLIYDYIYRGYILDTSFVVVGIISICFYSWVICGSFSS